MRTPGTRKLLATFALLVLAFAATNAGCGKQGEGERCSVLNNNDDCDTGLVCTPLAQLKGSSDICCPPGGSTNPNCVPSSGTGAGGAGATTGATTGTTSGGGATTGATTGTTSGGGATTGTTSGGGATTGTTTGTGGAGGGV